MSVYVIHLEEGIQHPVCVFNTVRPLEISHFRKEGGGRGEFLNKLWCCVGVEYYQILPFYQLYLYIISTVYS